MVCFVKLNIWYSSKLKKALFIVWIYYHSNTVSLSMQFHCATCYKAYTKWHAIKSHVDRIQYYYALTTKKRTSYKNIAYEMAWLYNYDCALCAFRSISAYVSLHLHMPQNILWVFCKNFNRYKLRTTFIVLSWLFIYNRTLIIWLSAEPFTCTRLK